MQMFKIESPLSRYNDVLKNGLPNWKSALYYYRRVRKMGLAEMAALLFAIITVGQYIVAWAVYAEKKYTAVSALSFRTILLQQFYWHYILPGITVGLQVEEIAEEKQKHRRHWHHSEQHTDAQHKEHASISDRSWGLDCAERDQGHVPWIRRIQGTTARTKEEVSS